MRSGLVRLSQRLLGPNSIVQAALPEILSATPQHFFDETVQYVEENARNFYNRISKIPGLRPVEPQGAMYMMVCDENTWSLDFSAGCFFLQDFCSYVEKEWKNQSLKYFLLKVINSELQKKIELPKIILALYSKFGNQYQKCAEKKVQTWPQVLQNRT